MNKQLIISKPSALPRLGIASSIIILLPIFFLLLSIQSSHAGSATWKANPSSGDWNTASNWTPATVPDGPSDTATFATSNQTNISISANTRLSGINFNPGASPFTITGSPGSTLSLSGVGITNNSGTIQNFVTAVGAQGTRRGHIRFSNSATAGTSTVFTNNGGVAANLAGGDIIFLDHSSAGSGIFINNGGAVRDAFGGFTVVGTVVGGKANAADATLIANDGSHGALGGTILFSSSHASNARVQVFGNGNLDVRRPTGAGVTIGSLEGDGRVLLSKTLTVGGNNLDTTFSGRIESATSIGMLVKVGTGTLTLTNANTYSGGTIIHRGKVLVNNTTGSGTGQGPVFVLGGRLGGIGTVKEVQVGDGSGRGAFLSAGKKASNPGTLTIKNGLFFGSDATYRVHVNSTTGKADKVAARSVAIGRIGRRAQFSFSDFGNGTLPVGTVFTVIENTSSRPPITGTFTNLADGAVFSNNGNSYQVDYQGGDGNDLTLTVVP